MPVNDNFPSATVITGASGSLSSQTNTGAGVQSGEPAQYKYNPGPAYPTGGAPGTTGPFATVWYAWTAPFADNYYFTTRDLTGAMGTNFPSTIQVFTGSAVNSLTRVTTLMDQSVGDGNGADNGASIAFAAVSGTTYYIQVDGRVSGATGNFILKWAKYVAIQLGNCGAPSLNFNTKTECFAKIQITDLTTDNYTAFGIFNSQPGTFAVRFAGGNPSSTGCTGGTITNAGGQIIVDGTFGNFTRWQDYNQNSGSSYAAGDFVAGCVYNDFCGAAVAIANVPAMAPMNLDNTAIYGSFPGPFWILQMASTPVPGGTFQGGAYGYTPAGTYRPGDYYGFNPTTGPYVICNANVDPHWPGFGGGRYWNPIPTLNVPTAPCSEVQISHRAGGGIGIVNFAGTGPNTTQNPTYQLVYYPLAASVLSTASGFALSGSGTSWTINFNLTNLSGIDFDNTTVALLNTGGVSGASGALTIDLAASTTTNTGNFTFTATPGLVTATIQLTRNGVLACTLAYPLYPIMALSFTAAGGGSGLNVFERTGCAPHTWVQAVRATTIWPPGGDLPSSWGDTVNFVFSIASGPATLANDGAYNVCLSVANISGSISVGGITDNAIKPGIWVTGAVQSVPIQCTLLWAGPGISLPAFTQTLSIPAS